MSKGDLLLAGLALGNLAAFSLFWFDKEQARDYGWRVPERHLLLGALVGGIGAWLGQQLLRHKTRKEPFRTQLALVLALHVAGLVGLVWVLRGG